MSPKLGSHLLAGGAQAGLPMGDPVWELPTGKTHSENVHRWTLS